jgi:hypothetical protein
MKNCAPCLNASAALDKVLKKHPEFTSYTSQLWKENHPSLVVSYELELFPTLIILDKALDEINRVVGSKKLTEEYWLEMLTITHSREEA